MRICKFTDNLGSEHVSTSVLAQRGIRLGYTPEVLTDAGECLGLEFVDRTCSELNHLIVADITVMLALMATRLGRESMQIVHDGKV